MNLGSTGVTGRLWSAFPSVPKIFPWNWAPLRSWGIRKKVICRMLMLLLLPWDTTLLVRLRRVVHDEDEQCERRRKASEALSKHWDMARCNEIQPRKPNDLSQNGCGIFVNQQTFVFNIFRPGSFCLQQSPQRNTVWCSSDFEPNRTSYSLDESLKKTEIDVVTNWTNIWTIEETPRPNLRTASR